MSKNNPTGKRPSEQHRSMGFLIALLSTMAAFFGVQSASNMQRDVSQGRPWQFIVAAALLTVVLVTAIAVVVNFFWVDNQRDVADLSVLSPVESQLASDNRMPFTPPKDTLAQRLQACTSCHNDNNLDQQNGFIPSLKGKPQAYLYNQLKHFQLGQRQQAAMQAMLENMTDAYLWEIAGHFSAMPLHASKPQSEAAESQTASLLKRGEQLVREGDRSADIPACQDCHGQALTGQMPATPALLGLPEHYILAQLGAWKNGVRHAAEPDCMGSIAKKLSSTDMQAVAAWLAGTPLPDNPTIASPKQSDIGGETAAALAAEVDCGMLTAPSKANPPKLGFEEAAENQGAYLAKIANCAGCHSPKSGPAFSGGEVLRTDYGDFYPPNISPDKEYGLGRWTSEQFWQALNQGFGGDRRRLYPVCLYPSYSGMERNDTDSIFAYLQTLPAVNKPNQAHDIDEPYKRQPLLGIWRAVFYEPLKLPLAADKSEQWHRGRYLVKAVAHCDECHAERNVLGAKQQADEAAGRFVEGWHAGSLNAEGAAGMQSWTMGEIQEFLKTGRNARASASGPMARVVTQSLQHLTNDDAKAMAVYLKSLPPEDVDSPVTMIRVSNAQAQRQMDEGRQLYQRYCQSCHGGAGEGTLAAVALANNPTVASRVPVNAIRVLVKGGFSATTDGNPRPFGMPAFAGMLEDDQIAAILTYVRNSWGNNASAVSPVDVGRYGDMD